MSSNLETFDASIVERYAKQVNPLMYGLVLLGEIIFLAFFLVIPYLFPILILKIILYLCVSLPAIFFLMVLPLASDGQSFIMTSAGIDVMRKDNKEGSVFGGAGGLGYVNAFVVLILEKILAGGIITGLTGFIGYKIGTALSDSIATIPFLSNDTFRLILFSVICFVVLYLLVFYILGIVRKDKQSMLDVLFGLKSFSHTKMY